MEQIFYRRDTQRNECSLMYLTAFQMGPVIRLNGIVEIIAFINCVNLDDSAMDMFIADQMPFISDMNYGDTNF